MSEKLADAAQALLSMHSDCSPGGFSDTELPQVRFFFTDRATPRVPLHYPPGLAIILQGQKIGYLDGRRFDYGAGSYLVVGLPLVFECETKASVACPLFGLFIELDPAVLTEFAVLVSPSKERNTRGAVRQGVEPLPLKPEMQDAIRRLIEQLCSPPQASVLGEGTLREIMFHALNDVHGNVLVALTQMGRPEARIAELLRWAECQKTADIDTKMLARHAGMSPATLHRHFRVVTGFPPLQYFKRQRLIRARDYLSTERFTVAQAAHAIGYGDPTNFSRDYKKLFGHPPSHDRQTSG